jgi:hypothetical protein
MARAFTAKRPWLEAGRRRILESVLGEDAAVASFA